MFRLAEWKEGMENRNRPDCLPNNESPTEAEPPELELALSIGRRRM